MSTIASNTMKLFISLFILAPVLAFAATAPASNAKNTELLFVMLAKKGAIKEVKPNQYQLTLKSVNPYVMSFTNSPKRYTSKVSTEQFVTNWKHNDFAKVPPNAVIEAVRLNGSFLRHHEHSVSYAVELTNPHYNKSKDELTFTIKQLAGSHKKLPDISHADYVAMFIDNALVCPDCVG